MYDIKQPTGPAVDRDVPLPINKPVPTAPPIAMNCKWRPDISRLSSWVEASVTDCFSGSGLSPRPASAWISSLPIFRFSTGKTYATENSRIVIVMKNLVKMRSG